MEKYKGIETSYSIPAIRALGMLYPKNKRIYNDPFAEKILSGFNKYFVKLLHVPFVHKVITNSMRKNILVFGVLFLSFQILR